MSPSELLDMIGVSRARLFLEKFRKNFKKSHSKRLDKKRLSIR